MTQDEIMALAKQVGFLETDGLFRTLYISTFSDIKAFAKRVAAAEREACAKVCDHMASRCNDIRAAALESAAENIRARGQA
jgi:hypothetical protein